MQLNVEQYNTLMKLNSMIREHKDLLNSDEIELLENADRVLAEVFAKHQKMNKKTAEYIAKKRITNKNYARSK